jgi:hypothetical protein
MSPAWEGVASSEAAIARGDYDLDMAEKNREDLRAKRPQPKLLMPGEGSPSRSMEAVASKETMNIWLLIAIAVALLLLMTVRERYVEREGPGERPSFEGPEGAAWRSKIDAQIPIGGSDDDYMKALQKFYDTIYAPLRTAGTRRHLAKGHRGRSLPGGQPIPEC